MCNDYDKQDITSINNEYNNIMSYFSNVTFMGINSSMHHLTAFEHINLSEF